MSQLWSNYYVSVSVNVLRKCFFARLMQSIHVVDCKLVCSLRLENSDKRLSTRFTLITVASFWLVREYNQALWILIYFYRVLGTWESFSGNFLDARVFVFCCQMMSDVVWNWNSTELAGSDSKIGKILQSYYSIMRITNCCAKGIVKSFKVTWLSLLRITWVFCVSRTESMDGLDFCNICII